MAEPFSSKTHRQACCLDIKPVHNHGLNCFEDTAISLLIWMNRRYEPVFADTWGFELKKETETGNGLLGDKIGPGSSGILPNIKKYYGLDFQFHEFNDPGRVMSVIRAELNDKKPVLIYIDAYCCPWHGQYRKLHQHHYCLVIGMNHDSALYCIDPIINSSVSLLPYGAFLESSGNCTTFVISDSAEKPDYHEKFNEVVARLFNNQCFAGIRNFADIFLERFNFTEEFKCFEKSIWDVLFYRNMNFIAGGRMLFSLFLKFLAAELKVEKFLKYSDDLVRLSSKWNTINGILLKSYFTGFDNVKKQTMAELFKKIADWEEQTASALLHFDNDAARDSRQKYTTGNNPARHEENSIIFLDLTGYFNNKGFAEETEKNTAANFTGTGFFFLATGLPENRIWSVQSMKFRFPGTAENTKDNIACAQQELNPLPQYVCSSILFLGCAEYGNFFEELQIEYADGTTETMPFQFTDWAYLPVFGEAIAWKGDAATRTTDTAAIKKLHEARIFAREYALKAKAPVKKIVFPDCSNIHIFAVSLRTQVPVPADSP